MKNYEFSPEEQLQILEQLKPKLGRFIKEKLYNWGLGKKDIILVDEAGFGYTGIPIFGPELKAAVKPGKAHIDIAIKDELFTGPRSKVEHPIKINLPYKVAKDISDEYGIAVWDFIQGRNFFDLPTEVVRLGNIEVLVPEPFSHTRTFAQDTILYYTVEQMGEDKMHEWFKKLQMIRDVSRSVSRPDVQKVAEEMIKLSKKRWGSQEWKWLYENPIIKY